MSLVSYLKEARDELKKVIWPNRQQATRHTLLVIGVSIGVAAFLGLADYLLNLGVQFLINR